jgi:hypothetical protein
MQVWALPSGNISKWNNVNLREKKIIFEKRLSGFIDQSAAGNGNRCTGRRCGKCNQKAGIL